MVTSLSGKGFCGWCAVVPVTRFPIQSTLMRRTNRRTGVWFFMLRLPFPLCRLWSSFPQSPSILDLATEINQSMSYPAFTSWCLTGRHSYFGNGTASTSPWPAVAAHMLACENILPSLTSKESRRQRKFDYFPFDVRTEIRGDSTCKLRFETRSEVLDDAAPPPSALETEGVWVDDHHPRVTTELRGSRRLNDPEAHGILISDAYLSLSLGHHNYQTPQAKLESCRLRLGAPGSPTG
eukprot:2680197-Rhodomonas_salina.2